MSLIPVVNDIFDASTLSSSVVKIVNYGSTKPLSIVGLKTNTEIELFKANKGTTLIYDDSHATQIISINLRGTTGQINIFGKQSTQAIASINVENSITTMTSQNAISLNVVFYDDNTGSSGYPIIANIGGGGSKISLGTTKTLDNTNSLTFEGVNNTFAINWSTINIGTAINTQNLDTLEIKTVVDTNTIIDLSSISQTLSTLIFDAGISGNQEFTNINAGAVINIGSINNSGPPVGVLDGLFRVKTTGDMQIKINANIGGSATYNIHTEAVNSLHMEVSTQLIAENSIISLISDSLNEFIFQNGPSNLTIDASLALKLATIDLSSATGYIDLTIPPTVSNIIQPINGVDPAKTFNITDPTIPYIGGTGNDKFTILDTSPIQNYIATGGGGNNIYQIESPKSGFLLRITDFNTGRTNGATDIVYIKIVTDSMERLQYGFDSSDISATERVVFQEIQDLSSDVTIQAGKNIIKYSGDALEPIIGSFSHLKMGTIPAGVDALILIIFPDLTHPNNSTNCLSHGNAYDISMSLLHYSTSSQDKTPDTISTLIYFENNCLIDKFNEANYKFYGDIVAEG